MKKYFFVLLSLCMINAAHAQLTFGLKAGFSLANLVDMPPPYDQLRPACYAGGLVQIPVTRKLLLQPEVMYSLKGAHWASHPFYSGGNLRLNYLDLPVLIGYRLATQWSVLLGPYFAYFTGGRSKFQNGEVYKITSDNGTFDKGLDLGIAYNINTRLGAEIRYEYGFKGLYTGHHYNFDPNGYWVPVGSYRYGANRVLQLGMHYRFSRPSIRK